MVKSAQNTPHEILRRWHLLCEGEVQRRVYFDGQLLRHFDVREPSAALQHAVFNLPEISMGLYSHSLLRKFISWGQSYES